VITYTDDADAIDVEQLEVLRRQGGFRPLDHDVVRQQLRGSRYVAAAWDGARLVGFVRAISDGITNAYVCTMVVHEDYRRRGIGTELVRRLVGERDGVRWVLHSADDAVQFYERLGFQLADKMMRRDRR
jgi:ribosomal protein S18 acetylase RimI-like enzyme